MRLRRYSCLLLGIVLWTSHGVIGQPTANANALRMSFQPQEPAVLSGAPCVIQVYVVNESSTPEELDMAHDGPFWFEIIDVHGDTVCASTQIFREGGSRTGTARLQPGDSVGHRVILNHWCTTHLPPGEYKLLAHCTSWSESEGQSSTTIVIREASEEELKSLHSQLADSALDSKSLRTMILAEEELLSTDSPYAVVSLGRLLRGTIRGPSQGALESLKRIGTPEAIQEIAEAVSLEGERFGRIPQRAAEILRTTYDSTDDPVIREICRPIVERREDKE